MVRFVRAGTVDGQRIADRQYAGGQGNRVTIKTGIELDRVCAGVLVGVKDRLPQTAGQITRARNRTVLQVGHREDAQQVAVFQWLKTQPLLVAHSALPVLTPVARRPEMLPSDVLAIAETEHGWFLPSGVTLEADLRWFFPQVRARSDSGTSARASSGKTNEWPSNSLSSVITSGYCMAGSTSTAKISCRASSNFTKATVSPV